MLVSIIMPAFNVENYIEESIVSIINQSHEKWELIIIDDGSTDLTAEICRRFINLDNRIKYIYQENSKQASARNNGISIAKGDIIAFLDADDLWLPDKLETTLFHFDLEKFDLIFTDFFYGNDKEIHVSRLNLKQMNIQELEYCTKSISDFIQYNRIPILTVLVKRDVIEQVGLFDENCVPAEDYDLWLRLLKNNFKFQSINIPLSVYRIQEFSSTARDRYASNAVINSIVKNFSSKELIDMKVQAYTVIWIRRWIADYLNNSNVKQLKKIISHFNHESIIIKLTFLSYKFIGFTAFKRIILKFI